MGNPRAPIFAAAGAVVIAILLVVLLVLPKMGQVSTAKEDLAAAASQEQTLETQKGALEDTKAQAPENKQTIDEVHAKIPPTADEAGLIQLINLSALDSGLDLTQLAPSPPVFDDVTGLSTIVLCVQRDRDLQRGHGVQLPDRVVATRGKDHVDDAVPAGVTDSLGNQVLTVSMQIDAYTSDASAGPGSTPGPTEAGG